jgi:hypothetical protein
MKKRTLPTCLTPAATKERERFLAARNALLAQAKATPLSILVWGPGPRTDSPVATKRQEIREELLRRGFNAMFSEEIPSDSRDISMKSKEFAEARTAHLVIILVEDSAGAIAEAHDFCEHPDIAPNLMVFIPLSYKQGYSAQGAMKDLADAYGGVFWYSEADLSGCEVCTLAIRRAEARRLIKVRGGGGS